MMVWLRKNFEDKTIIIPYANSDSLINSLRSIRRETTQSGIRYDADRDDETGHADEAFALALAMFAFKSKSDAKFLDLDINGVIG
jgi:phage FluMu gp28-like protein